MTTQKPQKSATSDVTPRIMYNAVINVSAARCGAFLRIVSRVIHTASVTSRSAVYHKSALAALALALALTGCTLHTPPSRLQQVYDNFRPMIDRTVMP